MNPYIILQLKYKFNGVEQVLFPVLLFGENDIVLVDCGYPGSLELLEEQMREHNVEPGSVTKLLLTHQDDDHMGTAAEWKRKYPAVQILASEIEEPYISGKQKNLRLQQAEDMQSQLPDEQKEWGEQFCARLRMLDPVPVDLPLHSGDIFEWGGGCEILHTLGHTPGHVSIRSLRGEFCITGDAAVLEGNELVIANPGYCLDIEGAEKSLKMLRSCQCRQYICYHGGLLNR